MRCAMTRADNRRALKILAFKFGRECFEIHSPLVFFCYVFGRGKILWERKGIIYSLKAEMG